MKNQEFKKDISNRISKLTKEQILKLISEIIDYIPEEKYNDVIAIFNKEDDFVREELIKKSRLF